MLSNQKVISHPTFHILSPDQLKALHYATLEVLETTGVVVNLKEAREILHGAGAFVGKENRVKIPSYLVEDAIKSAPSRIVVSNQKKERRMDLSSYNSYFGGESSNIHVMDLKTQKPRECLREDVRNLSLLHDSLPNLDFIMLLGQVGDVPHHMRRRVEFKEVLFNTSVSPLVGSNPSLEDFHAMVEMAALVAGGYQELRENPSVIFYTEPISPLTHDHGLEIAMLAVKEGLPVVYTPMPIGGATAPITPAGNLVLNNAECLSGITILQLYKRGSSCIYGGIPAPLDMRTMIYPYGAPELTLLSSAMAELGRFYDLPVFGTAGCGDSKALDAQTGVEFSFSTIFQVLSGANLIHDIGLIDHANICSLEAHLLMDELVDMLKVMMGGLTITPETLALDVIQQVGPGKNYVDQEHTYRHFREIWSPRWFDKSQYENWVKEGQKTLMDRLNNEVHEILERKESYSLAPEIRRDLDKMEKQWEKEE